MGLVSIIIIINIIIINIKFIKNADCFLQLDIVHITFTILFFFCINHWLINCIN